MIPRLIGRRRVIWSAIGAGACVGLGTWELATGRGGRLRSGSWLHARHSVTQKSWALGTQVSITVLHRDPAVAKRAATEALAEVELIDRIMSIYRADSQLSRLNRNKVLCRPHPYLVHVLRLATSMSKHTSGAFDVTVQPLWAVYAGAKQSGGLPGPRAIEQARAKVDWRRVEVSPDRVRLHGTGTQVTLNGIGQGFAVDRAMAALRRWGVQHALIDSGEIGTLGGKDAEPWKVGIQHPRHPDAYLGVAQLRDRCLATSGDYATSFSPDHCYNHIFDPHTGRSPTEFASVSVAAATGAQADALSTALFVLGLQRGLALVRSVAGADALFVLKDGTTLATDGFREIVTV